MGKSYIKGRRNKACCALIEHLRSKGIAASVAHGGRGNVLFAYCQYSDQVELVPKTFEGWDVISKHYSEIESPTS